MANVKSNFLGRGKGWEHTYQVRGTWPFPTDMLRYDEAEPATPADALQIEVLELNNALSVDQLRQPVVINIRGKREPTEGRWRSFNWRVL